ncbi:MAG: aminoacetone oxidase family FAD-binding enzyme [Verrucomicrobia bacterium]|nr:aminoacetone oxidase family FAD-binding enzyme [Verrucomicrobiota bacterium]MBT7067978.1 aminoacetone oxidase family FAD-binding enzyme [Verrucomicrobiota bacterium]MBT7699258.1 aminoacetone oxidase family FAD-binding enzyme [Verrucomicrobiota bacterium]
MSTLESTPLVIIGAGAAGLMAACHAGERGVPALLLERKHRAGSKLLMCGNGRCNLSSCLQPDAMLADFGDPLDAFLRPAIRAFTPAQLQHWFEASGLPLMRTRDGKVFPRSERAADVVKCLSDVLRRFSMPICYNAPVESITAGATGFTVQTRTFRIEAERVLLATGGVSYPKTGSVGDGQRLARELGHRLQPYRPGLVGIDWSGSWLAAHQGQQFKSAHVRILDGDQCIGETTGLLECERWGLGGGAISNATRLISRLNARNPGVEITYAPMQAPLSIPALTMRPLKEAMVTVGGVDLRDISPATMASTVTPGLYFAGEVIDVDGPTGGYNLTAAFATARLAVSTIAKEGHYTPPATKARPQGRRGSKPDRRRRPAPRPDRRRRKSAR